jgi:hypothetical protein
MGELARRTRTTGSAAGTPIAPGHEDIDEARANRLLPTFTALLGGSRS